MNRKLIKFIAIFTLMIFLFYQSMVIYVSAASIPLALTLAGGVVESGALLTGLACVGLFAVAAVGTYLLVNAIVDWASQNNRDIDLHPTSSEGKTTITMSETNLQAFRDFKTYMNNASNTYASARGSVYDSLITENTKYGSLVRTENMNNPGSILNQILAMPDGYFKIKLTYENYFNSVNNANLQLCFRWNFTDGGSTLFNQSQITNVTIPYNTSGTINRFYNYCEGSKIGNSIAFKGQYGTYGTLIDISKITSVQSIYNINNMSTSSTFAGNCLAEFQKADPLKLNTNYKVLDEASVPVNTPIQYNDIANIETITAANAGTVVVTPGTVVGGGSATVDLTPVQEGIDNIASHTGVIADSIPFLTGTLSDIADGVGTLNVTMTGLFDLSQPINLEPLKVTGSVFSNKFPFSLPWDLLNSFKTVAVPAVKPNFTVVIPDTKLLKGFHFDIDLSQFETMLSIAKTFELIIFDIGLIMLTRKLLGGAT